MLKTAFWMLNMHVLSYTTYLDPSHMNLQRCIGDTPSSSQLKISRSSTLVLSFCYDSSLFMQAKQNLADIIQMLYQAKARQIPVQSDSSSLTIYPEYILPYLVHTLAHNSCPSVEECKDVGAYDNIYRYYVT